MCSLRHNNHNESYNVRNPVAIDYSRFLPTGRAYLTLTHPDLLRRNLTALQNATVAGISVTAQSAPPPSQSTPPRTRGVKGRSEAAERGLITGNGPRGGIVNPGRNVVVWGLPGKMTTGELRDYLRGMGFSWVGPGKEEIVKLEK